MMAYREIEVCFHLFLSFTLDGVNDNLPIYFRGKTSSIHLIGCWMGIVFGQDV